MKTEFERLIQQTQQPACDLHQLLERSDAGHADRVADLGFALAVALGQSTQDALAIATAARWHDVGKAIVDAEVLNKPGPLTSQERLVVDRHVWHGHAILISRRSQIATLAATVALLHHERFDGSGHPFGLRADATPLAVRIVAVADVFDALMNERPYKRAWSRIESIGYIWSERGRQFDPACVDALISVLDVERPDEICRLALHDLAAVQQRWRQARGIRGLALGS